MMKKDAFRKCISGATGRAAVWLSVLVLGLCAAVSSGEAAAQPSPNTMCPVLTDEEVDPGIHLEYEGREVYFCCKMCRKDFLADPAAYVGNLASMEAEAHATHAAEDEGAHEHAHDEDVAPAVIEQRATDAHGAEHEDAVETADPDEGKEHDHATDHDRPSGTAQLITFLGKFHPLVVHFPIALVLGAFVAEVLGVVTRKSLFSDAARFSIALAAISVVVTVGLGWAAGVSAHYPGELTRTLWLHRWVGTVTGFLVLATAALSEKSRLGTARGKPLIAYRALLLLASVAVGVTGHLGATLIYGPEYFTW